jgi:hypothetical protein
MKINKLKFEENIQIKTGGSEAISMAMFPIL